MNPPPTMSLRLERWACFALGTLTLSFANGATASILAAWIAPLLLLRFVLAFQVGKLNSFLLGDLRPELFIGRLRFACFVAQIL